MKVQIFAGGFYLSKPRFFSNISGEMPVICICLMGLVVPEIILMQFFFTPSCFAKNSMRHLFAFPFSGAAESLIFIILLYRPQTAVLLPAGTTFTGRITPVSI